VAEHESSLAVLVDFENMARPGVKGRGDFDIHLVLNRLSDKGRVLVKRAYADWSRYRDARHELQNAGLELIEMPSAREGAKNRADIKMAVDAMELAFSREHLDTFVIVSGDSDFTPLVGKLRELNKRVTGMGNRESASELLIANCDEFIFYDSLAAAARSGARGGAVDPTEMLRQTLTALQREGTEWPLASVVKDSMRRKNPAFDESDIGYSTFSKFLEVSAESGLIRLQSDPRSGTYRVELANSSAASPVSSTRGATEAPTDQDQPPARRRRRRRRGEGSDAPAAGASEDVFEFVIDTTTEVNLAELPPLDQPISYEDMILLGPELGESVVELVEATNVDDVEQAADADATTPSTRRRRRRRGSGAGASDEPDAATSGVEQTQEDASTASPELVEVTLAEDEVGTSRRRRRRSTPAEQAPIEVPDVAIPEPEAVIEVVVNADGAVVASQDSAPSRGSRRVPRGARSIDRTDEPTTEVAPAAPKRRTRKTAPKAEAATTEDATALATAEDAPAAPKRRTRKAATTEDATALATTEDAPAAPKRRTRKAATPEDATAQTTAEDAPAAPKRRTRKATPKADEA